MRCAAFLDRDGVLNASILKNGTPRPPSTVAEVTILPGVLDAISLLVENNYVPVVITNQPDIARGTVKIHEVERINKYIGRKCGISDFYTCPHDDADGCHCRKPLAGLITTASTELELDLSASFLVGDRWRDIEAGQSVDLPCFFIDYSYKEKKPKPPYKIVSSLYEAVQSMIGVEDGSKSRFSQS
jgi:D-glycero-D-manno-heptose 1,7-bisphosphate phosphatase